MILAGVALMALLGMSYLNRRRGGARTLRDRMLGSLAPAALGAALGFAYARYTLGAEALQGSNIPAMYSSMGAVVGILVVRVGGLFIMMFQDFFGKDSDN
jgi:hypothetical protein